MPRHALVTAIRTLLEQSKTSHDFWLSLFGALIIMIVFSVITVRAYIRKAT